MKKYLQKRRYLMSFDTGSMPKVDTGVVIVGSGVAGLRAGIEAAKHTDVVILTKDVASESNTFYAQGGIAVVLSDDDSLNSHIADTLEAGAGLCDEETVRYVVEKGPPLVRELIDWGTAFDRDGTRLLFTQEGGHSHPRIIHANGDSTGREMERALLAKASASDRITIVEHAYAVDVVTDDGQTAGVLTFVEDELRFYRAPAVIIASGGACHIYRESTNPETATGDGVAMAYRAGAALSDLEFVQFHPTTLYIAGATRTLISETVRGEGGKLVDRLGVHFMPNYHPSGDLAPRDIVTRGIIRQMALTHDTSVYLDLRHLDKAKILKRFPKLADLCSQFDIDISKDTIPVRPSAHYFCGGAATGRAGETDVPGLYVCGEAASTGLHGANRLGSNSLLEGLVFGWASGMAAAEFSAGAAASSATVRARTVLTSQRPAEIDLLDMENSLRSIMWRQVGIEREARTLADTEARIDFWSSYVMDREFDSPEGWQIQNMLTVAKLITLSARMRTESRGAHHRTDFPDRDDRNWNRRLIIKRG